MPFGIPPHFLIPMLGIVFGTTMVAVLPPSPGSLDRPR